MPRATPRSARRCLQFFSNHAALADRKAFVRYLAPLRDTEWVVYAKKPFGGPEQALRYMARYTHRVAIANSRLVAIDHQGVSFKWKDYRLEGPARIKVMTLTTDEFIRRFLIHVLPAGFHRIRHYGLFASNRREQNIAQARQLLSAPARKPQPAATANTDPDNEKALPQPCPCCGGRMMVIEIFARGTSPRHRPTPPTRTIRLDTS